MAISLKTIAARCGKDVSTISRALRDDPRVKQATRDEIKSVAAEMGYTPNLAARSLRLGATKTVWFFAAGTENPMVREAAEAAATFLRDADYDLLLTLHGNDEAVLERLLNRLEQGVCDGAIIVPNGDLGLEQLKKLSDMGYPIAFLDRHLQGCDIPVFTTDNHQAARDLVKHCLAENVDSVLPLFSGNTVEDARLRGAVEEAKASSLRIIDPGGFEEDMAHAAPGRLAILGSSQGYVCDFYSKYSELLRGCDIVFGVFDNWVGEPFPACVVYVCQQNFESMASLAVESLLKSIDSHDRQGFRLTTVPFKRIIAVRPSPG